VIPTNTTKENVAKPEIKAPLHPTNNQTKIASNSTKAASNSTAALNPAVSTTDHK